MLILTRKSGQSFQVGDEVTITITEIVGDVLWKATVRLPV